MSVLIGPFSQIITFGKASLRGPLQSESLEVIENGGILMENGHIKAVNAFESFREQTKEVIEMDEPMVLLPGFIDCHTHLIWGGSRAEDFERRNSGMTYQEILQKGGGIMDTVRKTNEASDEALRSGIRQRSISHLKNGVTTIEVKSGYGLGKDEELRMLRIINDMKDPLQVDLVSTFLGAHVCPGNFEKEDYLQMLMDEVFPVISKEKLSTRLDVFVEPEAFPVELARNYLIEAKKHGFELTVHAGQFTPDGVQLAIEQGALSADHLESVSEFEVELLAKSNTVSVALPGASLGLGMPFTPARKLLDGGAILAVATDWNPGSAPMGDLLTQSAILATYEKLNAAEVFAGITFRAAAALGLRDRGRLVPEYLADLVAFPVADYREILYHQGQIKPTKVWKSGQLITG